MKIRTLAVFALGLACTLAALPALAGTLVSTLGTGGTYNTSLGLEIDGNEAIGNSFTLDSPATVTDAVLALGFADGVNNPLSVYIESDNSGLPGGILATLTQDGTISATNTGGLVTFDCSGVSCDLAAGTYWLVAANSDPNSIYGWFFNNVDAPPNIAFKYVGGDWGHLPGTEEAFQINGTPAEGSAVPEPSSFLLFGSGLAGLAGMLRRKLAL